MEIQATFARICRHLRKNLQVNGSELYFKNDTIYA